MYTQGSQYLKKPSECNYDEHDKLVVAEWKHCCLGVLCEMVTPKELPATPLRWRETPGYGPVQFCGTFSQIVPSWLLPYVGLSAPHRTQLEKMNDKGQSFDEIADYIERLPYQSPEGVSIDPEKVL